MMTSVVDARTPHSHVKFDSAPTVKTGTQNQTVLPNELPEIQLGKSSPQDVEAKMKALADGAWKPNLTTLALLLKEQHSFMNPDIADLFRSTLQDGVRVISDKFLKSLPPEVKATLSTPNHVEKVCPFLKPFSWVFTPIAYQNTLKDLHAWLQEEAYTQGRSSSRMMPQEKGIPRQQHLKEQLDRSFCRFFTLAESKTSRSIPFIPFQTHKLETKHEGIIRREGSSQTLSTNDSIMDGEDEGELSQLDRENSGQQGHQHRDNGQEHNTPDEEDEPASVREGDTNPVPLSPSFLAGCTFWNFFPPCASDGIDPIDEMVPTLMKAYLHRNTLLRRVNDKMRCQVTMLSEITAAMTKLSDIQLKAQIAASQFAIDLQAVSAAIGKLSEDQPTGPYNLTTLTFTDHAGVTVTNTWKFLVDKGIVKDATAYSNGTNLTRDQLLSVRSHVINAQQNIIPTYDFTTVSLNFDDGRVINFWDWIIKNQIVIPDTETVGTNYPVAAISQSLQNKNTQISALNSVDLINIQREEGERQSIIGTETQLIRANKDLKAKIEQNY